MNRRKDCGKKVAGQKWAALLSLYESIEDRMGGRFDVLAGSRECEYAAVSTGSYCSRSTNFLAHEQVNECV